ncbi:CbiX/SirB N-terminal domain-containing protein [Cellulomonas sp. ATA003]|uniref:sirohydrochlorin chelatase n=1 Tax=Cellulomonas sp. ATA003 TaxID=3073064 RepID=UPI00287391AC|nr:CbiX/SirB N-terminal domain-containing protein [Cellulomonas sp. ATA003]WNB87163.1 CbiX/SirB N-terminal domain-containing protein [Cellulomonas sp. ATA003]
MSDLTPSAAGAPVLVGCSHGTDSVAGRAAIRSIVEGVRRAQPTLDVREAFVDVQTPEVADVVADSLTDAGAAVVVPLLLSAGFHVHVDIAQAVAPDGACASGALGPDPRLVAVLVDRLNAAGAGPGDAVVLAAAGSSDARAAEAVEEVAAGLRAAWPHGAVVVGYGAGATPSVPDAVATARTLGERVVIASYLLAPGFFHDRLLAAGADVVTEPLAPDDRLVEIVVDRYRSGAAALTRGHAGAGRP